MAKWINNEYLAGFFDGEGSIAVNRQGWKIVISITNTYLPILKEFQKRFGGQIDLVKSLNKNHFKSNKKRWHWRIQTKDKMTKFLEVLFPFLVEKQKRAIIGLKILAKMSSGRGNHGNTDMATRKLLVEKLSALNRRGAYSNG